jgi:hypothetical protein
MRFGDIYIFGIDRGGALHPRPKDRGFTPLSTPHSYKLGVKADLVMKKTLKTGIGEAILKEVVAV